MEGREGKGENAADAPVLGFLDGLHLLLLPRLAVCIYSSLRCVALQYCIACLHGTLGWESLTIEAFCQWRQTGLRFSLEL